MNGPKGSRKKNLKAKLMRRHQNCPYCGAVLTKDNRTIEHIIPKSVIGRMANQPGNLTLCCRDCNGKRGNRLTVPAPK